MNSSLKSPHSAVPTRPKLVLASVNRLMAELLAERLKLSGSFAEVRVAGSAAETLAVIDQTTGPHLVLSELVFTDACGWDFFHAIAARPGPPKIVAYADDETGAFFEAQYLGCVDGFVTRDMSVAAVEAQLLAACGPAPAFSPRQFEIMRRLVVGDTQLQTLSARDLSLVRCLVRFESAREIAGRLGISISGVHKAKQRIMRVLGVLTLGDLATKARRLGLVPAYEAPASGTPRPARVSA